MLLARLFWLRLAARSAANLSQNNLARSAATSSQRMRTEGRGDFSITLLRLVMTLDNACWLGYNEERHILPVVEQNGHD